MIMKRQAGSLKFIKHLRVPYSCKVNNPTPPQLTTKTLSSLFINQGHTLQKDKEQKPCNMLFIKNYVWYVKVVAFSLMSVHVLPRCSLIRKCWPWMSP